MAAGATPVGAEALEWQRILLGLPRVGVDTGARELPQETGQDYALHHTKGCYIGQEIVERIRARGQVHRRFTGFDCGRQGCRRAAARSWPERKRLARSPAARRSCWTEWRGRVALGYAKQRCRCKGENQGEREPEHWWQRSADCGAAVIRVHQRSLIAHRSFESLFLLRWEECDGKREEARVRSDRSPEVQRGWRAEAGCAAGQPRQQRRRTCSQRRRPARSRRAARCRQGAPVAPEQGGSRGDEACSRAVAAPDPEDRLQRREGAHRIRRTEDGVHSSAGHAGADRDDVRRSDGERNGTAGGHCGAAADDRPDRGAGREDQGQPDRAGSRRS